MAASETWNCNLCTFENAEDAATNVQNILGDLSTTYGKHVAALSDKQIAKLAFYEERRSILDNSNE